MNFPLVHALTPINYLRIVGYLAIGLLTITACSTNSSTPDSDKAFEIAKRLHELPMKGFKFSEVKAPEFGFDYQNKDSSFYAYPNGGALDATYCESVHKWVTSNLSQPTAQIQYNAKDLGSAVYGCKSLLPSKNVPSVTYAGFFDSNLIQVSFEATRFIINVDGYGYTSYEELMNVDPKIETTTNLLNVLAKYREDLSIGSFKPSQLDKIIAEFETQSDTNLKITQSVDADGKVRRLYMDFGQQGLLPFCMSIDSWNAKKYGADPGSGYLLLLQNENQNLSNFGFAYSGKCL